LKDVLVRKLRVARPITAAWRKLLGGFEGQAWVECPLSGLCRVIVSNIMLDFTGTRKPYDFIYILLWPDDGPLRGWKHVACIKLYIRYSVFQYSCVRLISTILINTYTTEMAPPKFVILY
jgi:hypothetical protein